MFIKLNKFLILAFKVNLVWELTLRIIFKMVGLFCTNPKTGGSEYLNRNICLVLDRQLTFCDTFRWRHPQHMTVHPGNGWTVCQVTWQVDLQRNSRTAHSFLIHLIQSSKVVQCNIVLNVGHTIKNKTKHNVSFGEKGND